MTDITTNTTPTIIDELRSRLSDVKDRIKQEGVSSVVFDELSTNAKMLQDKLNELFQKKGFITQSDINDAYEVLKESKKKELELMNKEAMNKLVLYSLLIVGIGVGAYFIFKKK